MKTFDYVLAALVILCLSGPFAAASRLRKWPPPVLWNLWLRMVAILCFGLGIYHRTAWLTWSSIAVWIGTSLPDVKTAWRHLTAR